jgi:hypothetical protein
VARGDGDGQQTLQSNPKGASASEVAALILSGKEAAAAGHMRDAEVAFLNACRNAEVVQGGDGVSLADAMYQLGRHYSNVAMAGAANKQELLQRAERLYSASLQAYQGRYGASHEKTKFAQQGLAAVQSARGGRSTPATAAATATAKAPAAPLPARPVQARRTVKPVPPAPAVVKAPPEVQVAPVVPAATVAAEPRVTAPAVPESHVATAPPRPVAPRPRAPERSAEPEVAAPPGVAAGDAGTRVESPPPRPRAAAPGSDDGGESPQAEGSPSAAR